MVTEGEWLKLAAFDGLPAIGLLQQLDNIDAQELLALLMSVLRPEGGLVSVEPCIDAGQSIISCFLVLQDRGQNVRTSKGYSLVEEKIFDVNRVEVRKKRWIPYTHCFMEVVCE